MSYNFSIFIQNIMKDTHPRGFGRPEIGQRRLWKTRDRPEKALAGQR
jgi:hypothetical protein